MCSVLRMVRNYECPSFISIIADEVDRYTAQELAKLVNKALKREVDGLTALRKIQCAQHCLSLKGYLDRD